jgi:hypothetical protein
MRAAIGLFAALAAFGGSSVCRIPRRHHYGGPLYTDTDRRERYPSAEGGGGEGQVQLQRILQVRNTRGGLLSGRRKADLRLQSHSSRRDLCQSPPIAGCRRRPPT